MKLNIKLSNWPIKKTGSITLAGRGYAVLSFPIPQPAEPIIEEKQYRMLEVGETIIEGDEYRRFSGSWGLTTAAGAGVPPHSHYRRPITASEPVTSKPATDLDEVRSLVNQLKVLLFT